MYELRSRSEYLTPADFILEQAIQKFMMTLHLQEFRLHIDLVAPALPKWTMLLEKVRKNELGLVGQVC